MVRIDLLRDGIWSHESRIGALHIDHIISNSETYFFICSQLAVRDQGMPDTDYGIDLCLPLTIRKIHVYN